MAALMRKFLKGLFYLIGTMVGLAIVLFVIWQLKLSSASKANMAKLGPEAPLLNIENRQFRDLNKNGLLDNYEDSHADIGDRIDDLISQMTLEEKAGTMFINFTLVGPKGDLVERPIFGNPPSLIFSSNSELIARKRMNHFSLLDSVDDPAIYISWHNKMQKMAERTRLGIPVTFASDPRHGIKGAGSISLPSGAFSKWPEPLGMAATGDAELTYEMANIARQEYRAVGIHLALHPVADLATEPRWSRISGTFGEDANMSAKFVGAYIRGMQGDGLNSESVATMVKHFTGGGPQKNGEDAHFPYGQEQVYPGDNFDYHLIPFEEGAFPAGTAQVMPYYGIPVGQADEDVGYGLGPDQ